MPLFKPNIAALKEKRDLAGLAQALKTNDARTRRDAIIALGDLGNARAVSAVIQILLMDEKELGEKIEAADALGKLGDASAIQPLVQANETSIRREKETIEAVLAKTDRRYRDNFYVNRISTDEFELRSTIAQSIAKIGGAPAIDALFKILAMEHGAMETSVKSKIRQAIDSVLQRPDATTVPALCAQLASASVEARHAAANYLGEHADPQAIDALIRVASDENENFDVREIALTSLGKIGDARILSRVEDLMDTPNRVLARDARQCAISIRQRLGLPFITGFGSNIPPVR